MPSRWSGYQGWDWSQSLKGRKPKPTNLRIIEGNPGKRPINKDEPKPPAVTPTRPEWLLPEAKREWNRVAPVLESMGLLMVVDRAALAGYCQAWGRYVEADANITKYGSVLKAATSDYVQPNPYVSIARQSLQMVRAFCSEFGLTPSSRGRMSVPGSQDDAECPKCTMPVEMCGCG